MVLRLRGVWTADRREEGGSALTARRLLGVRAMGVRDGVLVREESTFPGDDSMLGRA